MKQRKNNNKRCRTERRKKSSRGKRFRQISPRNTLAPNYHFMGLGARRSSGRASLHPILPEDRPPNGKRECGTMGKAGRGKSLTDGGGKRPRPVPSIPYFFFLCSFSPLLQVCRFTRCFVGPPLATRYRESSLFFVFPLLCRLLH